MKILILGGTGAMGTYLVRRLAGRRDEVTVTSRRKWEDRERVHYRCGNAHEMTFLKNVLSEPYDAIVDFMVYAGEQEFAERRDLLLDAAGQYLFLSSARVYADSLEPIREDRTPRLLDVCRDETYLATEEYALSKARQENFLRESGRTNWTIIRPYITYGTERLQLGVFEKEAWLYRALHGRTIVFPKDMAACVTTMTCGDDVAGGIEKLIGNADALGKTVHLAAEDSMRWNDVLELYLRIIKNVTGKEPKVKKIEDSSRIAKALKNPYQICYDRLLNRRFSGEKANQICHETLSYRSMEPGLEHCLTEFLNGNRKFREINWRWEACADRLCQEQTPFHEIPGWKAKIRYGVYRYCPWIEKFINP